MPDPADTPAMAAAAAEAAPAAAVTNVRAAASGATGALRPFKSLAYAPHDGAPGPRLIVTGAVHGNETCGTVAIERVAAQLDAGELALVRGALTLVPVCNPLAWKLGRREGERNLNRALAPTAAPRQFEDHVANWLCPLIAAHDVLLDLHSFLAGERPFAIAGPAPGDRFDAADAAPFAHARAEQALVRRLGVDRALDGWLETYALGVARRRAEPVPGADALQADARYGRGTTEWMRAAGGWAVTLECGRHDDPRAPDVAQRAVVAALAHLGLIDAPAPAPAAAVQSLRLHDVVDRHHPDDRFVRAWRSFDALAPGEPVAVRADGRELRAPAGGGWIVFPNVNARPGQEWFYLAGESGRFAAD